MIRGYILECPRCCHEGPAAEFEPSCADECTCPKCGCEFEFGYPEDEEVDESEEE